MGARSGGGSRGGGGGGASEGRDKWYDTELGKRFLAQALEQTLSSPAFKQIKDQLVAQDIKDAIKLYANEIGFSSPMTIQVGSLPKGKYAMVQGSTITLSKAVYNRKYDTVKSYFEDRIKKGWVTATDKPVAKTIVHEFAHKTYKGLSKEGQKQVDALFTKFSSSKSTKGWGVYSKQSVTEFYSDGIAKSLLGKSDSFTKALRKIK